MAFNKNDASERARTDLASRLGVSKDSIPEPSVESADFPDAALGAPLKGEMSAQMITPGWRIRFKTAEGAEYEYRASRDQVRLFRFEGSNHTI